MTAPYTTTPRVAQTYLKPAVGYGSGYALPPAPRQNQPDDYEKWYTEYLPTNRMLLSLRSGIPKEVDWALERMCRLSANDQFVLKNILGLTDALVEWPEWYVEKGAKKYSYESVFSTPLATTRRRRHALEAIFILRNASLNESNVHHLAGHGRTYMLIFKALRNLKADSDINSEFLLHIVDLLHSIAPSLQQPHINTYSTTELIPPLEELAETSNDRTMIVTALRTLTLIVSLSHNAIHLSSTSPALKACIRYLPLLADIPLITACLDYLYAHLSHPPMVKAFLLHPMMPSTLKLLANLLLKEQQEEMTIVDLLSEPVRTAPAVAVTKRQCELNSEDLERIAKTAEPERSYEWLRSLFVASDAEEMTQVEFWTLYRETFSQYQESQPILTAADVIKNVSHVFPTAQAMVMQGPQPRFVIRGITRRMMDVTEERFKCQWNRSTCTSPNLQSPSELFEHVVSHLKSKRKSDTEEETDTERKMDTDGQASTEDQTGTEEQVHENEKMDTHVQTNMSCQWSNCNSGDLSPEAMKIHISTHMPTPEPPARHPSQLENVTLPTTHYPHPSAKPTARPPPPPPNPQITFARPSIDPPSTSLTALLIIRVLFRASFATTDAAPRADEDHFGFPGIIEEDHDDEMRDADEDAKGQRRGRKAFIGIRRLLEEVRVRDDALMAWIGEILDVSMDGKPTNV